MRFDPSILTLKKYWVIIYFYDKHWVLFLKINWNYLNFNFGSTHKYNQESSFKSNSSKDFFQFPFKFWF